MMNERKVDHLPDHELFPVSGLPLKPKELRSSNKVSTSTGKVNLSGKKPLGISALSPEPSSGPKASPPLEKEIVTQEKEIQSLKNEIVSSVKDTVSSAKKISGDSLPVGTRLKKARETKGLSLDIVHEGTKIPMDALRAIEEGYSVRILSPFYYKGFLKIYGDFLGVDVAGAGAEDSRFKVSSDANHDEGNFFFRDLFARLFNVTKVQQGLSFLFVLFIFFLLFKGIVFIFHRPRPVKSVEVESSKEDSPSMSAARQEASVLPRPRVVVPPPVPVSPPVQAAAVTREPSAVPIASVEVKQAPTPVAPQSPPASAPSVVKNVTLVVRARTDSWLRVAVDGEVVFQATLGTGSVKTWLADEKIEISGRNLEQLEMELNGKMIGALGRRQRGAKSILITKDGLTVLQ